MYFGEHLAKKTRVSRTHFGDLVSLREATEY